MTMPKIEPVAWLRDTLDGGLSTMTDCCTNVVKEIWLKANPKNVERYTAPLYTLGQLTEAYEAGKREQASELEAARAEIERLKTVPMKYRRMAFNAHLQDENAKLNKQLAAEQAKNTGLRDALKSTVDTIEWMYGCTSPADDEVEKAIVAGNNALSTPSDTAALEAIVKKAGEVMLERVVETILASAHGFPMRELRILPAVTLEDLK